jgi:amidase
MAFLEYASHDGLGLAELVRRGEVTAAELVEEAIARIERHNPTLNAVIFKMYDRAREVAGRQPPAGEAGPLQGVPFLLKDILGDHQGVPTTSATKLLQGVPAAQDAELTRRFKAAGLIPLGKTNVPEIGTMPTTEPHLYGPARNPWNPDHSTGGSSGGSAAAVAAGIVPIAHANDGGGSIRIPASCCGLVGMKPTRARNPLGPLLGDMYGGLVMEHVVTRSVRDSAAVLDRTAGPDIGDPYWAPPVERPFLEEVGRDPGRLRIACWPRNLDGAPVHADCEVAVQQTAELLADLGHHVEEASIPVDAEAISAPFTAIWGAGAVATLDSIALATGRELKPEDFEPLTWSLYEQGRSVSGAQYMMALTAIQQLSRRIAAFFQDYDAWVTPTLAMPPVQIGVLDTRKSFEEISAILTDYIPFTPVFNVTGQPAISLPLHTSAEGLPVGVQFAGRFGEEGLLYRLAGQLECARPWIDHKPPIWD